MRGNDTPENQSAAEPVKRSWRTAPAVLALAVTAAHGWALGDGLFLDDHWHQQQLRELGWSPHELLSATSIEPDEFIGAWWQDRRVRWEYPRPVAVALMKVVHELTDGSVVAHHTVSLVLHFLAACMVCRLCFLLTANLRWSVVGGLLFVVYSHSVFAVGWLASQNILLQTALMLAALLFYVRASGLQLGPDYAATTGWSGVPRLRIGAWVVTLVLWVLAIFSRENAVVLPVVLAAFDLAFGGRRHVRARLKLYAPMVLVALAFAVWRVTAFHPMPDFYVRRPDGDGYLLWCLAKLMHYLSSSVWLSPMTIGPSGRYAPFSEVPGDCLFMAAILAIMGTGYVLAC
ncbi:MAG TPA: hypothetical protein VGA66_02885, partial [Mycobacterium sp.]